MRMANKIKVTSAAHREANKQTMYEATTTTKICEIFTCFYNFIIWMCVHFVLGLLLKHFGGISIRLYMKRSMWQGMPAITTKQQQQQHRQQENMILCNSWLSIFGIKRPKWKVIADHNVTMWLVNNFSEATQDIDQITTMTGHTNQMTPKHLSS